MSSKLNQKIEYGDFQTPENLARQVCARLSAIGVNPSSVLEPNCGKGNFLFAALSQFPAIQKAIGVDINHDYVEYARRHLSLTGWPEGTIYFQQGDFFGFEWKSVLDNLPQPVLIIGNPPWITNSGLSSIDGTNLPRKSNIYNHSGLDARTGKSNFDISEWMLIQMLNWISGRAAVIAMLCKTSVARKIITYAWSKELTGKAAIYHIDAGMYFGVAVDACLFVFDPTRAGDGTCTVYDNLSVSTPKTCWGYREGRLIANMKYYEKWVALSGVSSYQWRSGIKHDCAKVMELRKGDGGYWNGLGENIELEDLYLYPMLKGSDIANRQTQRSSKWMLVTQRFIGEDTGGIQILAPRTWAYLKAHEKIFKARKSSIYQNRPPFSIFGVGDYSFSMWKVAISSLYKKLEFSIIGPQQQKSVMLDDTCYFIACDCEEEANILASLLNSEPAKQFYSAFIFWDAKRPITIDILKRLDLLRLSRLMGAENVIQRYLTKTPITVQQLTLPLHTT